MIEYSIVARYMLLGMALSMLMFIVSTAMKVMWDSRAARLAAVVIFTLMWPAMLVWLAVDIIWHSAMANDGGKFATGMVFSVCVIAFMSALLYFTFM